MNYVVDHINYHGCEVNGVSVEDGNARDVDNENDNNNNDYSNDGDNDNDSDEDYESFLRRQFDIHKLILSTAGAINMYYINYMHKEHYMVSYNTCMRWLNKVFSGN